MLALHEFLENPVSAEEFLANQRKELGPIFKKEIDALLEKTSDPNFVDATVKRGEEAMQNLYVLPGTGGKLFDVGEPPAWTECRSENEEYLWGLARMPGLAPLTAAYLVTGDEKYAKKAIADIENFITTCPPFPLAYVKIPHYIDFAFSAGTVNPWRQLENGFRLYDSWNKFYTRMLMSDLMTPEFHAMFAASVYQHEEILRTVSPILFPTAAHNHYIFEMSGLLVGTLYFKPFKHRDEWHEFSLRQIERCVANQIMADGAQLEGCPGYHSMCLESLFDIMGLIAKFGVSFSEETMQAFSRAISYQAWTLKPTGGCSSLGDSTFTDHGIPNNAGRYYAATKKLDDYAKICGIMRRPPADQVPEEVYQTAVKSSGTVAGGIRHFESVGQIVGRTGFRKDDSYFTMICRSPVFNGHAHCDPLSIELNLEGREVVIDPSFVAYTENDTRRIFKSAYYHSCVTFGGKEPFEYRSTWAYGPQKPGWTKKIYEGDGYMAGDGWHENYEPAEHRRLVILLGKKTFLVVDDIADPEKKELAFNFHLDGEGYTAAQTEVKNGDLRILSPYGDFEIIPAEKSPRWDIVAPSTRIVARDTFLKHRDRCAYVTVFTVDPAVKAANAAAGETGIQIRLAKDDCTECFFWKFGESLEHTTEKNPTLKEILK